MNDPNQWQQQPPQPNAANNPEETWGANGPLPFPPGYMQGAAGLKGRKKSKFVAGLFAFLVPGLGHMYLGLMAKAIVIMLLFALNICGIVFVADTFSNNVLTIVLLSLLLPIIYFYNIFDVLQCAEAVNERVESGIGYHGASYPSPFSWNGRQGRADSDPRAVPALSIILLAAGGAILLGMANIRYLFHSAGSMIGAVILIGAGAILWLWERRGQHGGKQ